MTPFLLTPGDPSLIVDAKVDPDWPFYIKVSAPKRPSSTLPALTADPATARLPEVPPLVQPARSSAPTLPARRGETGGD